MTVFVRALVAGTLTAALLVTSSSAQQAGTPYRLRLTQERLERLTMALIDHSPYVPGELIVKFREGTTATTQSRALSVLRHSSQSPQAVRVVGDALLIATPDEPDPIVAAGVLQRQAEIEWVQPNYLRRHRAVPNDPNYSRLQWNFDLIDLPKAWDINPGAKPDIKIGIIDTGITTVTTSFTFRLWTGSRFENVSIPYRVSPEISGGRLLPGKDFIFWDGPVLDMVGHGTHVGSTVAEETNNSVSVAGIAYAATLMPLKVCIGYWEIMLARAELGIPGFLDPSIDGGCDDASVVDAIRYAADNGAQLINISLGGFDPSPATRDALRYAVDKGVFAAIAAGNEFADGNPTEYPAAYAADLNGVMAVGAIGRSKRRAPYSNTGSYVEIAAPGGDFDDGGRDGVIWQTSLFFPDFDPAPIVIRPRFDRYAEIGAEGTSMATPHVVGVAALLRSQGITKPAAIEAALKLFATDLGAAGRDNEFGYGLVNPRAALRGMGLVR